MNFPESKNGQGKILIAEDDSINQRLMSFHLKQWQDQLVFANNGKEALQLFRDYSDQISLVIMDVRMPLMDGVEATRRILELSPEAKVIALSAFAQEENNFNFGEAGFTDYITKPVKHDELLTLVKKYLG